MIRSSREFQVFVKPAGSSCNLKCSYCYYLNKKNLYPEESSFLMKEDVLEKYIVQLIEASADREIVFSWHGGEPILAGLDFYRKAVMLQKRLIPSGKAVFNGIQTNGTLLDDEWCRFLAEQNFRVGISLDGPEELHNLYRIDKKGRGSFAETIRGYRLLQKHGINPEILCVVNARNVNHPLRIYRFFRELDAGFMTFLPLVERQPGTQSGVSYDSVPAKAFGDFLVTVFEEWLNNDTDRIRVQIFEEAIQTAFRSEHTLCIFKVECGGVPVIEHNGDFYSCDHFVGKEYNPGNIIEKTLEWYLDSPAQKNFGQAKSKTLPRYCRECPVRIMCNGECPKNRFIRTPDGEDGLNYLCEGYRHFFSHIRPFVETVRQVAGVDGGRD